MVLLLRTFISFERKKSSGAKLAAKLRHLHQASQRQPNLIWLPFLRPGKPLAQTGAEIGEAKVKPATA